MHDTMTLAAVQLTSTDDCSANLREAVARVEEAAARGATVVALPECHGFVGGEAEILEHAQDLEDGPFVAPLREAAERLGIFVLAGSIPERLSDPEQVFNTSVLIGRKGETLAVYRKIHLFDIDTAGTTFFESRHTAAGESVVTADIEGVRAGFSICYDLRFPELYRRLSSAGARLLFVPAAFTLHTGKDHWSTLLVARAIENQCYVVAPAQFGRHSEKRSSWGKSMIIDPWGTVLATASEQPCVITAPLSMAYQDRVRAGLPCLQHRRLD